MLEQFTSKCGSRDLIIPQHVRIVSADISLVLKHRQWYRNRLDDKMRRPPINHDEVPHLKSVLY